MKRLAKLSAVIALITPFIGCGGKPDEPKKEATADALPAGKVGEKADGARPEMTFQIRDPWDRGDAVRVRLDVDRLRAYDLSKEDVMRALTPSGVVDPREPLPPPGVVFDRHLSGPEGYENVILKANAEGDVVRLKDVATVERLAGRGAKKAEPNAAVGGGGK